MTNNNVFQMNSEKYRSFCGNQAEEAEGPLMREVRSLDKLIDELAKSKQMEKILRK